ncbi:hypothetical protein [Levilactobacillus phage ENFP1]|nr:hypothetical protein [Levilactobacillus phage ENFP1]
MAIYKNGKKINSIYKNGKEISSMYKGGKLIYSTAKLLWSSAIRPYQLTNLQLDDNGWVYPTYKQYGFEQYHLSGSLLNTYPYDKVNIIGDLSIDITNDTISSITTDKHWNTTSYTSYNPLYSGAKNSSSVYSFNDAVSSPYNLPQYKSLLTAGSDGQYDLQKNNSTDWSPFAEKSFSTAGNNAHLLPLGGFDTNFNLVKYAVLAYSSSGIEVINPVSSTNITVNNNLNALLSNIKLQYSPLGYAKNVASQDSKRHFPAVYYLISNGSYVFLVELYYDTVLGNLSIYYINSWSTGNASDVVKVIQDDDGYANNLVGYSSVKDSASNILAVPNSSFSFYATVENGNSNQLVRVSYTPDASFGTFTSNSLDTWTGFTPVRGEKKGDQVSLGLCNTDIPWKVTVDASADCVAVDSESNVYVGTPKYSVYKLDSSGEQVWKFTADDDVTSVAVDEDGNVYAGTNSKSVYKIDNSGNQIWKFTADTGVEAVAVDTNSNVYAGTYNNSVYKINRNGEQIWKITAYIAGAYVNSVAVDTIGNVYVGTDSNTVHKINSNGEQVWKFSPDMVVGHYVNSVAVDSDGNVYAGTNVSKVYKLDSSGEQVWKFTADSLVYSVAVDEDGNVYAGTNAGSVYKIDNSGNQIWKFTAGTIIGSVKVDKNDNVYAGAYNQQVYKITPVGSNTDNYYQSKVASYKI